MKFVEISWNFMEFDVNSVVLDEFRPAFGCAAPKRWSKYTTPDFTSLDRFIQKKIFLLCIKRSRLATI